MVHSGCRSMKHSGSRSMVKKGIYNHIFHDVAKGRISRYVRKISTGLPKFVFPTAYLHVVLAANLKYFPAVFWLVNWLKIFFSKQNSKAWVRELAVNKWQNGTESSFQEEIEETFRQNVWNNNLSIWISWKLSQDPEYAIKIALWCDTKTEHLKYQLKHMHQLEIASGSWKCIKNDTKCPVM